MARTCILRAFRLQMPWRFFSGVTFVIRLYAFVEAAALRSIALRNAGVPIATRFNFIFVFYLEMSLFPSIYFVPLPISLCKESTSYVLSFRMVFFLPFNHGLDF